jgi:hypothetical protein
MNPRNTALYIDGLRVVTRVGAHGLYSALVVDTASGPVQAVCSGSFWKVGGDVPPMRHLAIRLRTLAYEIDEAASRLDAEEGGE